MLAGELFREIGTEFLRLLGSPGARVYIDAADELERASALRSGALSRDEALAILERVVERHADAELEAPPEFPIRERARVTMDRLLAARWLAADDRADYRRLIVVEANTAYLLEALRKIARPDAAVFSDKLVATCNLLRNSDALQAEPWQTVEQCMENVRHGVQELKGVAKSIERHTRHQLEAQSLRENLEVVFDKYAEQVGHGAYAELIRSRLPTRLPDAHDAVARLQNDTELLTRMAEEVLRRQGGEMSTAMAQVQNRLDELALALDRVVPSADEVDRRTADFTRKSLARFRYLQEVTGANRSTVQRFFELLNERFAGKRVAEVEMQLSDLPELLLVDAKLFAGLDSLYTRPSRQALDEIEPLDDDLSQEQIDRSRRQLASTLRDSLTVTRANRFAIAAFHEHGPRIASNQLLRTDDDLADLIACLLHAGSREACFEICIPRDADEPASDRRMHDPVLGGTRRLERFTLLKK
jgi:hypothetical protein